MVGAVAWHGVGRQLVARSPALPPPGFLDVVLAPVLGDGVLCGALLLGLLALFSFVLNGAVFLDQDLPAG